MNEGWICAGCGWWYQIEGPMPNGWRCLGCTFEAQQTIVTKSVAQRILDLVFE